MNICFFRSAKIQLFNDVKIKVSKTFNKQLLFFIFIFLHVFFEELNRNLYKNIAFCNTFSTVPNLLKLVRWLNKDINNKKNSAHVFKSDLNIYYI